VKTNMITQVALGDFVGRMNKEPNKNWRGWLLMDAAMVRYRNPSLPYTDISRRFMRHLLKKI